jgi:hypothetical protein
MNVRNLTLLAGCLLLAVGLGLMLGKNFEAQKQAMIIKTYQVPPERAEEIRRTLAALFASDRGDGNSQIFAGGTLVVKASETYHQGIAQLIDRVLKEKAPSRSVRFDYWMVRAEPAAASKSTGLDPLQTVLDTISKSQGPRIFSLLEHLSFNTLNGRGVTIKGAISEISAKPLLRLQDMDVELKLRSKASLGEIESTVNMKSGEFVVLGQTVLQPKAQDLAEDKITTPSSKDVYHILRAEILP